MKLKKSFPFICKKDKNCHKVVQEHCSRFPLIACGNFSKYIILIIALALIAGSFYSYFSSFEKEDKLEKAVVLFDGGKEQEAIRVLKKALKSDPKNQSIIDRLGEYYYRSGDLDSLIEIIEDGDASSAKLFNMAGTAYIQKGDLIKAQENYKKAIEKAPQNPSYYVNLASLYRSQKRIDEALEIIKIGIEKNASEDLYVLGSAIALEQGNRELAQSYARLALERNPENKQAQKVLN